MLSKQPKPEIFFDALSEAGFFNPDKNSGPVPSNEPGFVQIPFWPALTYLQAVAKRAGELDDAALSEKILSVVRSVTNFKNSAGKRRDNYHTSHRFAEILGLLPLRDISIEDIKLIGVWTNSKFERGLVGSSIATGLLKRLLASDQPRDTELAIQAMKECMAYEWLPEQNRREPGIIAAAVGRPLHAFEVRPRVLAGTPAVPNAVQISAQQLRQTRQVQRQLTQTSTEIRPVQTVPKPQALSANEQGRLGQHPPRAAMAAQNGGPNTAASNQIGQHANQQPENNRAERGQAQMRGGEPTAQQRQGQGPHNAVARPANPGEAKQRLGETPRKPNAEQRQGEVQRGPNAAEQEVSRGPSERTKAAVSRKPGAEQRHEQTQRGPHAERRQGTLRQSPNAAAQKRGEAARGPSEHERGALLPNQSAGAGQQHGQPQRGPGAQRHIGAAPHRPAKESQGLAQRNSNGLEALHSEVRGPAARAAGRWTTRGCRP